MKKFLIGAVSLIILVLFLNTAYYRWGVYVDLHPGKKADTFTSVKGKEILVDEGKGMEPFEIKGVDLGAGIPGHFATEYAIDKETYMRWFGMIQNMGANTIRVYTILSSDFMRPCMNTTGIIQTLFILSMGYGSMIIYRIHTWMLLTIHF